MISAPKTNASGAFTLIELLVVVSIISLLSSVVLSSLNTARDKARLGAGKSFASQVDRAAGDQAVGWWDFDECSGTSAADRSGSANMGTLASGASFSTDTPWSQGCSVLFDGSNDEVAVGTANLIGASTSFTISAWVKPSSTALETIYGEFTSNGDNTRNFLLLNNGRLSFDQWPSTGGSSLASNGAIRTDAWTHVAYVQNGTARYLYIDGKLDITDSSAEVYSGAAPTNARIGFRGSNQLGYSFSGRIDNVRAYTKALTASEIGQAYALEALRFKVAYE